MPSMKPSCWSLEGRWTFGNGGKGWTPKDLDINYKKALTLAEITLSLTNTKDNSNSTANIVDWIADGIKAQNDQWVLNI